MTTLKHRIRVPEPRRGSLSRAAQYEWRLFLGAEAHLYPRAQLSADWPPMVKPWCEEKRPAARRHERSAIGAERLLSPRVAIRCPVCGHLKRAANAEARCGQA
ncbi:hypothetical protein ACFQ68_19905 [Amycolatopsis japonica]|uniref:hypothetical protein n=1 Tax=Amycolatopsis japonica TaxID=208439 RepID=UPI00366FA788